MNSSAHSSSTGKPAFFKGLRGQLARSFVLVILVSVGIVAIIAGQVATFRLDDFGIVASRRRAFRFVPFLADFYAQQGSWEGVTALIEHFDDSIPPHLIEEMSPQYPWQIDLTEVLARDRAVLAAADGQVVADSLGTLSRGQPLPANLEEYIVPIYLQDKPIGMLAIISDVDHGAEAAVRIGLRRTLLGAGLFAGALALLVSFVLAHRITEPVRNLSLAARRLASGDSHDPLPVQTDDEIGEMTRAFNEMAAAIEEQKRLRRQMVADIAHELRTPLSIMQLEIEGLEDGLQAPAKAAASLHAEVDALSRLIQDLRLLSLADAGGLQLKQEELGLSAFLQQMVNRWQTPAQSRQVQLQAEIADSMPLVRADEERLAQIVSNLLSNALRYTSAGGTVTVGGHANETEAVLWVSDSGSGIDAEELPYLFERFYRTDRSRSRGTGGSGLGLAIAKQLVTLHGGRIWAESEASVGTTFYVALPAVQ